MRAKWYNIGLQLSVSVGTLDAIRQQYRDPSECLRETLTTWLRSYPLWTNIIDALKSSIVCETQIATNLEYKYCSTRDSSTAATHHHAPVVPALPSSPALPPSPAPAWMSPPSPASAWMSPPPQPTAPLTHPQPSFFPPWPYYYPPPTSYPMSTPFVHPPRSGVASAATHPTTHQAYSQPPQVTPGPTPSRPSLLASQLTIPHPMTSNDVQIVTTPQYQVQPAGIFSFCSRSVLYFSGHTQQFLTQKLVLWLMHYM